ncbi:hypothetical protein P4534_18030 [Peribacillus butanolivorans]|uniref:hypothetical protein n=1 Tax=Peribacillus butanolivorans TaxID=421767 RepID=UPI002E1E7D31|nr:hypothetical protein [Peribacillus butanolivorans]
MPANELIDILLDIGQHPIVMQIDFVCLDPSKAYKVPKQSKSGYAWLQFITGCIIQTR